MRSGRAKALGGFGTALGTGTLLSKPLGRRSLGFFSFSSFSGEGEDRDRLRPDVERLLSLRRLLVLRRRSSRLRLRLLLSRLDRPRGLSLLTLLLVVGVSRISSLPPRRESLLTSEAGCGAGWWGTSPGAVEG